jgi:hypothetical protein
MLRGVYPERSEYPKQLTPSQKMCHIAKRFQRMGFLSSCGVTTFSCIETFIAHPFRAFLLAQCQDRREMRHVMVCYATSLMKKKKLFHPCQKPWFAALDQVPLSLSATSSGLAP